jgi:hypothetical protein
LVFAFFIIHYFSQLGKINAQHYRKNALVHAIRSRDPVTVFKSWGSGYEFVLSLDIESS